MELNGKQFEALDLIWFKHEDQWRAFLCKVMNLAVPKTDQNYILITNLMHWLLFIHKKLFSCTCFEPQVLIFRRIQLYTCSIWYCHSLREFVVACRYTAWVRTALTQAVYWQATTNSHREWQYHMLHVYNCILLKMSTWGSKHVEENSIWWINNNQCIKGGD